MKLALSIFPCMLALLISVLGQKKPFDIEQGTVKNCVSLNKVNPENTYHNRRQIKTTCSKEDFMTLLNGHNLTCSQILVDHFYCDICFNQNENSLISYDGSEFYFENNSPSPSIGLRGRLSEG